MATLYHGTTLANWERIQAEGWNSESRKIVWECSCNEVYCYDLTKVDSDSEYAEDECIRGAFEAAQIAAAIQGYLGITLVVIKIEIDEKHVEDDYSCENMNEITSVVQPEDLRQEHIESVFRCDNYVTGLRLFYIAGLCERNPYICKGIFSDLELQAMKSIQEFYSEDFLEFSWYKA